uniref:G-protein coupled receptors family 1 profile domain-containing protein n=1 Tax=Denticeps clupeoides TaxID=299321 RepID=A0AAY4A1R6_9TELE
DTRCPAQSWRRAMETPITCLVLVQGLKTLMNWSTVILQRPHITRGFMGTFHISLNVVDTVLTLVLLVTHALQDVRLCGMRWTSHHVCLLLQISSFVYNALHWPVLVVSGLDHYWLAPLGSASVHWTRRLGYVLIAAALWTSAALHVFLSPGYRPHLQDTSHRLLSSCQAPGSPQVPQVSSSVRRGGGRARLLCHALAAFVRTWGPFLALGLVLAISREEVPAYLAMNAPWLCFVNSFLVSVTLLEVTGPPGSCFSPLLCVFVVVEEPFLMNDRLWNKMNGKMCP